MEKQFNFRIEKSEIKFVISNGEIISIYSNSNKYGKKNMEKTLEKAAETNLDKFLSLHNSICLNSNHYKMTLRTLKKRKKQLEEDISKIDRVVLE